MQDVDELDLGQLFDIVTTYNNIIYSNSNEETVSIRQATQTDFNRF